MNNNNNNNDTDELKGSGNNTTFLIKNDIKLFQKSSALSSSIEHSVDFRRKSDTDALKNSDVDLRLARQKLLKYAQVHSTENAAVEDMTSSDNTKLNGNNNSNNQDQNKCHDSEQHNRTSDPTSLSPSKKEQPKTSLSPALIKSK